MREQSKQVARDIAVRGCVVCNATLEVPSDGAQYRDRYDRTACKAAAAGHTVPGLPDADAPWATRIEQILTLAAALEAADWSPIEVCGLLRELQVRSQFGFDFDPNLLAYYRRLDGQGA